jgi:4-hydroxysphinganine ceramide fatty acyl 2-hydroxylase
VRRRTLFVPFLPARERNFVLRFTLSPIIGVANWSFPSSQRLRNPITHTPGNPQIPDQPERSLRECFTYIHRSAHISTAVIMPGRTLPTIPTADVQSHNNEKSCYVTIGTKVYDVTDFLDGHPGGGELVLEYGGKDVTEILKDEISHAHSDSAYEILDECLIGFMATDLVIEGVTKSSRPAEIVPLLPSEAGKADLQSMTQDGKTVYAATGMSSAEDLERETDPNADYKQHKFLDLSKPLLMQVWNGGFDKDFYLEQVHRPRHYKGGDSAPLFGNFLEPLSKTPWWVVPSLWWPCIAIVTRIASAGLSGSALAGYWIFGLGFWTIIEYVLHRCLFHLDA